MGFLRGAHCLVMMWVEMGSRVVKRGLTLLVPVHHSDSLQALTGGLTSDVLFRYSTHVSHGFDWV